MKRLRALGVVLVSALALAGCGSGDPLRSGDGVGGPLVVGSADIAESELLMEIYAEALRSTGADVQTKPRIGAREFYVNAAEKGELAVIPDYTGNLLKYLDPASKTTAPQAIYAEAQAKLPPGLGLLDYSPAEDSDVLTVSSATAASGVKSMADLGPRCGQLVLGAPAEWKSRWEATIAQVYGCTFKEIRSVEAGSVTVDALTSNQVQVANLFTTSSAIDANKLVKLDDPKDMFPAQNVVPLVAENKLNPQQTAALNRVSKALTTDKLTELNRRLEIDKANPADLAKTFVAQLH
jgi:osmoprotectant transport system substrate-binding protein